MKFSEYLNERYKKTNSRSNLIERFIEALEEIYKYGEDFEVSEAMTTNSVYIEFLNPSLGEFRLSDHSKKNFGKVFHKDTSEVLENIKNIYEKLGKPRTIKNFIDREAKKIQTAKRAAEKAQDTLMKKSKESGNEYESWLRSDEALEFFKEQGWFSKSGKLAKGSKPKMRTLKPKFPRVRLDSLVFDFNEFRDEYNSSL